LIEKIDSVSQLKSIDKETWFLNDYQNDVSIRSMRKALGFIQTVYSDNTKYYNHLLNYVVFWHFKTEATSQGEELYITMNARGEELANNEVTKAALMIDGAQIYEWGSKWEKWQQFFWKNRNKGDISPSADRGFNGFLACIAGLEYYIKDKQGIEVDKDVQKLLTLEKVEEYYKAFGFLLDNKNDFVSNYHYSKWVQKCILETWDIFNKNETDWFADYQDKNKSTERNRMIFIWSWMYYIVELNREKREIDIRELFRILRFFYLRFNNFNRSVSTLKKTLDLIIINGVWDTVENEMGSEEENPEDETDSKFRTSEETIKNKYFQSNLDNADLLKLEEIIWLIEDHPLNLDGRDVGNINLSHLIKLQSSTTFKELTKIRDAFTTLFPKDTKSGSAILKTILLHYGDFWTDTSYYNKRYDFSNWKRNIRKPEFILLINNLIGSTPELLLENLKADFLIKNKTDIKTSRIALSQGYSLREKLVFYSLLMSPENMWSEGEKVIIYNELDSSRLFKDENQKIYNSKGTIRSISDLWDKANKIHDSPLSEIINKI
jgi:hypothetical protein